MVGSQVPGNNILPGCMWLVALKSEPNLAEHLLGSYVALASCHLIGQVCMWVCILVGLSDRMSSGPVGSSGLVSHMQLHRVIGGRVGSSDRIR